MSTDVVVALLAAAGTIITAVIVGAFSVIASRSSKKVASNTDDLASLSEHAVALIEYYKNRAETCEALIATKDATLTTQRETVDRLLERQDALREEIRRAEH